MVRAASRVLAGMAATLAVLASSLAGAPGSHAAEPLPVPYNFLASALRAGTQVDADPPGANDWSCRPTGRHPRPVVLVHGTTGNKNTNWQTYAPLLANEGYCVFALTYGVAPDTPRGLDQLAGMTRMERSARELATFVREVREATGARKVDILGHSQGTLMPNYYAKFLGGGRYIKRYVSLAPLWHGTRVADVTQLLVPVFGPAASDMTPLCAACGQFARGSRFLEKMRAGGVAVDGISYTNIVTRYDQLVVPYTSGIERGMRNVVIQDHCAKDLSEHFEIAADPVAAAVVLNTLDPKHRRPVPCMLVLPFTGPVA